MNDASKDAGQIQAAAQITRNLAQLPPERLAALDQALTPELVMTLAMIDPPLGEALSLMGGPGPSGLPQPQAPANAAQQPPAPPQGAMNQAPLAPMPVRGALGGR